MFGHNPITSKYLLADGWQYADPSKKPWQDDRTLTISRGPLPPLPRMFRVTAIGAAAEKWPDCLGIFTRTERWWRGRQVYTNTQGMFLYHGLGDHGWVIGCTIGYAGALRGSLSACPVTTKEARTPCHTGLAQRGNQP